MQGKVLKTHQQHSKAIELMADSFYRKHPLWRIMPPNPKDVQQLLSYKVQQADRRDLVWGFFVGETMVAVALFYLVEDYLKQCPPKSSNSMLFDLYQPYFEVLRQAVIESYQPNKVTYFSDYIAVKPEYIAQGYGIQAYNEAFKMGQRNGCDDIFARMTNPVNKHIAESLGFVIVKELEMKEERLKGRTLQMLYMPDVKGFMGRLMPAQPKL